MKKTKYVRWIVEQYEDGYPPEGAAECVAWFQKVLNDIPEPYRAGAKIDIGSVTSYEDTHYGEITVSYTRPETDEEEAEREAMEQAANEERRATELRQLAALMDKYGVKQNG